MKMFIFLLLGLNSYPTWVEDINAQIEQIDRVGKMTKEKVVEDESYISIERFYKFEKWSKFEFTLSSKGIFRLDWEHKIYTNKGRIIVDHSINCSSHIHKGRPSFRGDGYFSEEITYYKNVDEGIRYKRSIEYSDTAQIDSLKICLAELPFEETQLTHEDYTKTLARYKRIKKSIKMTQSKRARLRKKSARKHDRFQKNKLK